jgi:23S rRNA pseudouridine955/2504/2580 synthase
MCRKGELRVDGARATSASRVLDGQAVRVPPPCRTWTSRRPPASRLARGDEAIIQAAVMWKDEHIMRAQQAAGARVAGGIGSGGSARGRPNPGADVRLQGAAEARHRLDKDTSGVLLLARTDRVARGLSEALRHRNVRKIYWAAVAGVPTPRAGTIKFGLVKEGGRGDEKMRAVHPREVDATPAPSARSPSS